MFAVCLGLFAISCSKSAPKQATSSPPEKTDLGIDKPTSQTPPTENTIYDSDTNQLWNRLNETLFIRTAPDGDKYGLDRLDILYWAETKHLFTEPSHRQALTILDEFINTHGEKLIHDPLKRALLQRDLSELFDWSAQPWPRMGYAQERRELQNRLVVAIRRLALTTNEIAALSDNYAQAVKNNLPGLPQGLLQANSDWVTIGINVLDGGRYRRHDQVAPGHTYSFEDRSQFFVLLHFPDGKPAAISYLNQLNSFQPNWITQTNENTHEPFVKLSPDPPQFPTNTEWALVRKMRVIDDEGHMQLTSITESIQVRRYLEIPTTNLFNRSIIARAQQFSEFNMSHKQNGALRAVAKDETDFLIVQFRSMGMDVFEWKTNVSAMDLDHEQHYALKSCVDCHSLPGIYSVESYRQLLNNSLSKRTPKLSELSFEDQKSSTGLKYSQYEWGLLQGLWHQEN